MKILHITNHEGTTKNIQSVFDQLNMNHSLTTEKWSYGYYVDKNKADDIAKIYETKIGEYDLIIFTDTSMVARPFLQNIDKHNAKIIIYITNRFDWGIFSSVDKEYYDLYSELSNHPRVIFCADNTYDQYYAEQNNIHFFYDTPIKLTPLLPELNITTPDGENKNKLFILDRGTKYEKYNSILSEYKIENEIFGKIYNKRYTDENQICEYKGILHLPYQVNIQSLWENLAYNIIYFIPSKQFMLELIRTTSWYYWEEKNKSYELFIKSIELSEWHDPDNEILFEYFDSWQNLKERLTNITDEEIVEKKEKIARFMEANNKTNLKKWHNVIVAK